MMNSACSVGVRTEQNHFHQIPVSICYWTHDLSRPQGLQDGLEDRHQRVNLITSMRFRTWELSVICTTETTDTDWERQDGHNIN